MIPSRCGLKACLNPSLKSSLEDACGKQLVHNGSASLLVRCFGCQAEGCAAAAGDHSELAHGEQFVHSRPASVRMRCSGCQAEGGIEELAPTLVDVRGKQLVPD